MISSALKGKPNFRQKMLAWERKEMPTLGKHVSMGTVNATMGTIATVTVFSAMLLLVEPAYSRKSPKKTVSAKITIEQFGVKSKNREEIYLGEGDMRKNLKGALKYMPENIGNGDLDSGRITIKFKPAPEGNGGLDSIVGIYYPPQK